MDVLTVFANSDSVFDDHAVVRVYWCTGLHRKKAIDVRLALTCQDRLAAAEAIAIRYLLGEENIFIVTGSSLKIDLIPARAIKPTDSNRQASTPARCRQ